MAINLGTIGAVAIAIGGDTSGLKKALTDADSSLSKTKQRMAALKQVSAAVGLALAATAGAIGALVKRTIDLADQAGKTAIRVGLTTESLTQLRFAAELSNVKVATFDMAMQRFTRRSAEAAMGTGEAVNALKELGVSLFDGQGNLRSSDELLEDVAEAMKGMRSESDRVRLAFKLFDSEGTALIPMLIEGKVGIRAMREEAAQFGLTITGKTAAAADHFNDNLTRLSAALRGQVIQITEAVLPTLQGLSDRWVDSAKKSSDVTSAVWAVDKALRSIVTIGTLTSSIFSIVGKTLGGVAAALVQLMSGRFSEAFTTAKNITIDWKTETQNAATSVLDTWEDMSKKIGSIKFETPATPKGGKPRGLTKEDQERNKKLLEEDAANWVAHAEAVFAAAEEEALALAQMNQEKWARIDENLEKLRDSLKTEAELQQEQHDLELAQLREAFNNKVLAQEEFDSVAEQLATQHQERMNVIEEKGLTQREKFQRMGMKDQAKTIFGELSNITSGVAQHNKKLFELNKIAGIAEAIINAYTGISRTLGAYPFPINVAMAAAHGLAAFAQVQAIRGASFGGGGGAAPALAGGTPAAPVTPVGGGLGEAGGGGQHITIVLPGTELTSTKAVREMLIGMQDELSAGGSRLSVR